MHRSRLRRKRLFVVATCLSRVVPRRRLDPATTGSHFAAMVERDKEQDGRTQGGEQAAPAPGAKRAEREARLAQQLRANLQRRKQQARGRATDAEGHVHGPGQGRGAKP